MNEYTKTLNLNLRTLFDKGASEQQLDALMKEFQAFIDEIKKSTKEVDWTNIDVLKKQIDSFKKQADKIKEDFNNLEIIKKGLVSDEDIEKVKKAYTEEQVALLRIKELNEEIAEIAKYDKDNKALKEMREELKKLKQEQAKRESNSEDIINGKEDKKGIVSNFSSGFKGAYKEWVMENADFTKHGKDAFNKMKDTISKWASKAYEAIKEFVESAIKELQEMASWDLKNSNTYNSDAVGLYMQTGLQGAEAYGFSKALETQGFNSFDDFISAMPFMNEQQLSYMKEVAEISARQYDEDLEVAREFQNFQKEYDVFKREMQKEVIDFFMRNKYTIMTVMKGIFILSDKLVNAVAGIVDYLTGSKESRTTSERQQAISDMLNISSTTNNANTTNNDNRNTKVTVNNTYNGVGSVDQTKLADVGQMTYQQIIEYFGRQ